MNGFLFIDKPKGLTSFDLVREVRKISGERKVGHSGTLDPLATGLMILALGEGTKLLEFLIGHGKEYEVSAHFGYVSDTYDAEGELVKVDTDKIVDEYLIEDVIKEKFIGKINQVPPKYSALKINGKKAYELAREGKDVEMKSREVAVEEFSLLEYSWPIVKFKIRCSSGTYIRSLVHDLGNELICGGYVEELRRNSVGEFSLEESVKLESLGNNFEQSLVSVDQVADKFPMYKLSVEDYEGLRDGKTLVGKKLEQKAPVMAFYEGK
ncbi:tRNA pseudouridine(55) synthase TruB, partial [Candidatus Peregrinibacteria bacterium]|nr:tRNA pseudouridine(55) synthase TruB [Candidatus Peregrinibacteria bacterium]